MLGDRAMTYHVRMRGVLTFADPTTAEAAFAEVTKKGNLFLDESLTLEGKKIRAEHDNFVPYSSSFDVAGAMLSLQAVANGAVSGKILVKEEGTKGETQIAPPLKTFGRKAKPKEYTDKFSLKGSLS